MVGLAKKMFIEYGGEASKAFSWLQAKDHEWPLLEKAFYEGILSHADISLAKRLLRQIPHATEAIAALICHLSIASRKGHLCVRIDNEGIYPTVEHVWVSKEGSGISLEQMTPLWLLIAEKVMEGSKIVASLPIISTEKMHADLFSVIYRCDNLFYLQRYWKLESSFLKHMSSLLKEASPEMLVSEETARKKIDQLFLSNQVLEEQAQAILQGCLHTFTVIIGGPGTGKTHTAGLLIKVLWESMPVEYRSSMKIALAAPTGKAAANLEGSIQQAFRTVDDFPKLSAQTLHALLGSNGQNQNTLAADVLLIDESSMIDVHMMALLMQSLKPGARLIMLGDKHQLPPVEAGALFSELVEMLQASEKYRNHVTELKTCLRVELSSILDLAKNINEGCSEKTLNALERAEEEKGLRYIPLQPNYNPKEFRNELLAYCLPKFPISKNLVQNPLDLLKQFSRFRLLTPLRKGLLGIEALNQLFFEAALAKIGEEKLFFAPIMIQSNDYRTELFNGEVGLLVKTRANNGVFLNKLGVHDYAIFASKSANNEEGGVRKIPALLLPKFDYAYCLSIHKSQGSEFEHVLLLLPEGCEQFGREALYTGVTRARRKLEIWGNKEVLQHMISQHTHRFSGVKSRFIPA